MLQIILTPALCSASARYHPSAKVSHGCTDQKAALKRLLFKPEHFTRWHRAALENSLILLECWLEGLSLNEVKQRTKSKASLLLSAELWQVECAAQPSWALFLSPKPGGGALPDNCSPLAPRVSGGFTHHMGFLWSLISSKKSHFATSGTPGPQLLSFSLTFSWVSGLHKSNLRFLGLSKAARKPA